MSVHIKKRHWLAKEDLKKVGKVFLVGVFLIHVPLLGIPIMVASGAKAAHIVYELKSDLDYIDYVLRVED